MMAFSMAMTLSFPPNTAKFHRYAAVFFEFQFINFQPLSPVLSCLIHWTFFQHTGASRNHSETAWDFPF